MDVCLINNHLLDFSFMSFIATLQLRLLDYHSSTIKRWNILKTLPTIQALVWHFWQNDTPVKTKTLQLKMLGASHCALVILLAMATKVTQISLMVWVALGKHQIAQPLRSEKHGVQRWLQACKLFFITHKVSRYSGLSSIKYQLGECKIWGNDSKQRNVDYLIIMRFVLSFIKVLKISKSFSTLAKSIHLIK